MPKPTGSETFGTGIIRTDEYVMMAQVMVENGQTVPEAAIQISAIDDMLRIHRMQLIISSNRFTATGRLRKNATLLDMIDKRVDKMCEELEELTD